MRCLLVFVSSVNPLIGQSKSSDTRARHPSFDNLRSGIFFKDAFQEGIRGQRPTQQAVDQPEAVVEKPAETFAWSRLIEAEVIEDEIKAIKLQLVRGAAA